MQNKILLDETKGVQSPLPFPLWCHSALKPSLTSKEANISGCIKYKKCPQQSLQGD